MIYQFIIIALVAVALTLLLVFKNKIGEKRFSLIMKVSAIALFVCALSRCFMNDNFIWTINGGTYGHIFYDRSDFLQSFLRWGTFIAYIVYPCAVFFKHRLLKNIAIYFCLPVAIVSLVYYSDFITYFTTDSGRAIYVSEWLRHFEFMLELFLLILIPLLLRFAYKHKFDIKNKKEWLYFFLLLPAILITVIPVTLPQSLFGFTNKFMNAFTLPHFLWIGIILLELTVLYFAFRFKDKETRYALCVFLALYLVLHYNSIYLMDFNMKRMPFQLCNLGSYLVLLSLLIKRQGFFNFVLLANVPGALIAFAVPDISEGMLSYWNIHFYIEHTWVFIIPLLMVSLRLFERPDKSAIKHFFIGFSIYALFCATAGIIANCVLYIPFHEFFNDVNYFYLFDTTVLAFLPFLGFTRAWEITLNAYTFYPLYMLMVCVLFSVFCMIYFYILKQLTKVGDNHFKLRQARIDLNTENEKYKNHIPKKEYDQEDTFICLK